VDVNEFSRKSGIIVGLALACGAVGFVVPLLFDRDVGGALAAATLGIVGLMLGVIVGLIISRRIFD
jgi:VIT1/CCC1 family predicted Fe2+/Mn2+ transporter